MEADSKLTGKVFDIQGWSVHDGPGCRTVIFMKGCTMNCSWCCNPEGINSFIEPLYDRTKCISDFNCIIACEKKAIKTGNDSGILIDKSACAECNTYSCVKACLTGSLKNSAYNISIESIFKTIQRDRKYWGAEGGITLSGGEPFFQHEFTHQLLKKCYDAYIHTAVETCGNVKWENISKSLLYLNWIYFDLKQMDNIKHLSETKAGNSLIIENARKIAKSFEGRLIFRMPVIPGFNDLEENIHAIADFLNEIKRNEINILPLHHLGREKYRLLGFEGLNCIYQQIPSPEIMEKISSVFKSKNIICYSGSDTPF